MFQYHIGDYVFDDLVEQGLPAHRETVPGVPNCPMVCDTDEVDAWIKEHGINLANKKGRRRATQNYITVDQAKRLFPQNPSMALLYAIFCTKDDYVKMFRI